MSTNTYFNGKFCSLNEVHISPLDRGFLFGDGIYESLPIYQGVPFKLADHLERLNRNCEAIGIPHAHTLSEWLTIIETIIKSNPNGSLYLHVTRGVDRSRHHVHHGKCKPTVLATVFERAKAKVSAPVHAITRIDERAKSGGLKSTSLLPNILTQNQAVMNGKDEAIMLSRGKVTESTRSTVFIVSDDTLMTPGLFPGIVHGVTREVILEIAKLNGFPVVSGPISRQRLFNAQEIWLVASNREISPVLSLNDLPISQGKPGPVWQQFSLWYREYVEQYCKQHSIKHLKSLYNDQAARTTI